MFKHIAGLLATVIGVVLAFFVAVWALLGLVFVAIGAAIVHAFRSRGLARERAKRCRKVIEGDFSVVDEHESGEENGEDGRHKVPPACRR